MTFKNMKISTKLFLGYSIIFIATIIISVTSLIYFEKISQESNQVYELVTKPMSHLIKFSIPYGNLRSAMRDLGNATTDEDNQKHINSIQTNLNLVKAEINKYLITIESSSVSTQEEIASVKKIVDALIPYEDIVTNKLIKAGITNQNDEVRKIISTDLKESGFTIREQIEFLTNLSIEQSQNSATNAKNMSKTIRYTILILLFSSLIISSIIATIIVKSITKSISDLVKGVNLASKGNFYIDIKTDSKDEIGVLSKDFYNLMQTLSSVIESLSKMCNEHSEGKIEYYIDEDKFYGDFKNVAHKINEMTKLHIVTTKEVIDCVTEIVDGNFNASIPKYPNDKGFLNDAVENLRSIILVIENEINILVKSAVSGNLSQRADLKKYKGDWKNIIGGLNNVLDEVVNPIKESSISLEKMSKGNLDVKISGEYKGDFSLMKNSFNQTTEAIGSYIKEINHVLKEVSNNNFDIEITREYVGQFGSIKNSLNMIIQNLSEILSTINQTSFYVASESKLMSQNSISLAKGVTTQASSIQELNSTIETVSEQTKKNVVNSQKANEISTKSSQNALQGNKDMENMLLSMEGIKNSSGNISQIIKVIDGIAFQTNLLALNAAIEAASAGIHGKGFAVVAEEVRNLAGRSKKAAQETAALIEESISRVAEGTIVANATADSLKIIVEDVKLISTLVSEITVSSIEQSNALSLINEGISQISQVVQENSATAEESLNNAQNLYAQSQSLQNMVGVFNFKK